VAEHPFDPDSDHLPSDALTLSAHDALGLVAGTGLAQVFACLPGTVWTTDTNMVLTFVQGQLIRGWQVPPEKLIGRTLPDLLLDGREDHPLIQGHLTALSGHETSVRIEWGGNLYNARIAPLRDATGAIVGCVGSHQQIGWLPDDDGLLRESDMRLRRVIDSNMIGIAFGDDAGQITEANEAFLHLAGYTREDLVADGISWPALTPVECHAQQMAAIDEVRATGRCTPFEVELIRKDGRRVPVLVGGARLSARRREGVAFVLDISERRNLRQRLAAELATADALLDAPSREAAMGAALGALCLALGWTAAELWHRAVDGTIAPVAASGASLADANAVRRAVERALEKAEPQWSDRQRVLVVPIIVKNERASVLVVSGAGAVDPDPWSVETIRAIGARIERFLDGRAG
jgi:PAS domain S-box-containing protein